MRVVKSVLLPMLFGLVVMPHLVGAQSGNFTTTGSMTAARDSAPPPIGGAFGTRVTATLLQNGQVLVAGGDSTNAYSAELYNPSTGKFTATGNMVEEHNLFTATLLTNGMVLIAGGETNAAELYNPATGGFAATGSMSQNRVWHTATLLPNGKVLIAGGRGPGACGRGGCPAPLASAELYDPTTGTFSATGNLITARDEHTATLLGNGTVLIAGGGVTGSGSPTASAELYNPSTGTFTATGPMNVARVAHLAVALGTRQVLVEGGGSATAEIYDQTSGEFSYTGNPVKWAFPDNSNSSQ